MRVNKSYFILFLLLFLILKIKAQQGSQVNSIFNSSDQKKINKANEYKQQANALIEEANKLYLEVFNIKADYQLQDKERERKAQQTDAKAQSKQLESIVLYQKSNEIYYNLNKLYIDKFWNENAGKESNYVNEKLLEEQSNDFYYQAVSLRKEAEREKDTKEKIRKHNEAYQLEILSLEKQTVALGYYYSLTDISSETGENNQNEHIRTENNSHIQSQSISEPYSGTDPEINQDMINQYQNYLNDSITNTDGFLTPDKLESVNSFNADQILGIWYNYIYNQPYNEEYHEEQLAEEILDTASAAISDLNEHDLDDGKEKLIVEIHEGEDEKALSIPADENVIFRVQVASNNSQLDQKTLQKMYHGSKAVEVIVENGLYKYSIGDFEDFESANKFRKKTGIKNAFIVAYRKGTVFEKPTEEEHLAEIKTKTKTYEEKVKSNNDGLLFRVQVAASKAPLNKEQVSFICGNKYPVEQIEEEGWFKYQVIGVRLFSDALKILSAIKVENAFVVAYENGAKADLFKAVKQSARIEKEVMIYGRKGKINETEFHVQLAASKHLLRQNEIEKIYSGNHYVTLIIDEDWYKYHVKAGFDYKYALTIKNECGVEKSFVTAYKNGKKVLLSSVIDR